MKGWFAANLFLLGMALLAAGFLFAVVAAARYFGVDESAERTITGCAAVAALFVSALIARAVLRKIERRR